MLPRDAVVQLVALCAVGSFFYFNQTLERHSLAESPRLSTILVFFLAGILCYISSGLAKLFPGANGRFAKSHRHRLSAQLLDGSLKDQPQNNGQLPKRPRRLSLPLLILCIVLRMEVFHRVNYQAQCSTPGVESFLCLVIFAYDIFSTRRKWAGPVPEDPDDPWRNCFDDLYDWFSGPRVLLFFSVIGCLMFTFATYSSLGLVMRSSYICFSPLEGPRSTFLLQTLGLLLNAFLVVLLWRLLAWSRTTKLRIQLLGTILVLASLSTALVWVSKALLWGGSFDVFHAGFGFLYGFDIIVDSAIFAALAMSAAIWVTETSPFIPVVIMTFLVGMVRTSQNIYSYGDWMHTTRSAAIIPLWFICAGMILFVYCHDLRSVLFIRRFTLLALLTSFVIGSTVFILIEKPTTYSPRHPINDFIYQAHIKQDHWLRQAAISDSMPVGARLYKERHDGRDPPPGYDKWYELAHGTTVVDQFDQIDNDLRPFWGVSAKSLRQRATLITKMPGVESITVKDGKASASSSGTTDGEGRLDALVSMINKFAESLPDMVIPINLASAPRILPSWEEANGHGRADLTPLVKLISRKGNKDGANDTSEADLGDGGDPLMLSEDYRQVQIEACSPGSLTRMSPHWSAWKVCAQCTAKHSWGPLLVDWGKALEYCSQPDLKDLYGMSLATPRNEPIRNLLPLFGPSKMGSYNDILIPIPETKEPKADLVWHFDRRYDTLFWKGSVSGTSLNADTIRGHHKLRLLHLVNNPKPRGDVVMVLPTRGKSDEYRYEKVSLTQANQVLPITMGIGNYTDCLGPQCELVKAAFGSRDEEQDPLEYRYVMLVDEDDGPAPDFMRTLRSSSVPFLSTLFQTWYTERLMPWMHFVPIDVRYQGLHSTFSYFTGTAERTRINGRVVDMARRPEDAQWIANEGRKWAKQAIGEKDMEVYLFRLLLEWGRLVDDARDQLGFRKTKSGEFQSDKWSKGLEW